MVDFFKDLSYQEVCKILSKLLAGNYIFENILKKNSGLESWNY